MKTPLINFDKFEEFLDSLINTIEEKYTNDEFGEGYQEAIDYFENEVLEYCDDNYPDLKCQVMEWEDDDYVDILAVITTLCQLGEEYQFVGFFDKNWNDSNFLVLVMKEWKDER